MNILAVDTASKSMSICIGKEDKLVAEMTLNTGLTHSEMLMPSLEDLFVKSKMMISDIDLFAVTKGPGSFTGLRIGISTINAFAYALGKKCVGIASLDVLAEQASSFFGLICPILDARRGEVYTAVYQNTNGKVERITEYQAIDLEAFLKALPQDQAICFIGEGVFSYRDKLITYSNAYLFNDNKQHILASTLAKMAFSRKEENTLQVSPFYLRESEALIRWKQANPGENINGL